MSDKLAQIGVITAPETKYAVRIQEEVPKEILKSLMISGMAGINIVSAYITMIAIIPSKDKIFQAYGDIFVSITWGFLLLYSFSLIFFEVIPLLIDLKSKC